MNTRIPMISLVAFCWAACATSAASEGAGSNDVERAKAVAERRMKKFGGFVYDRRNQKGRVLVCNAQKAVQPAYIGKPVEYLANSFSVDVSCASIESAPTLANAESYLIGSEANACIYIVDDSTLPMTLVAPEAKWAFVNVRPLLVGNPDAKLVEKRVSQQIWRTFGNLLGASDSRFKGCIMSPIASVGDLDRCQASVFSPEPFDRITAHLNAIGVTQKTRTTYRKACEQGWAPAPTNEYQKAIWEQVHAIPQKPLKIEFDPKTDTK